MEDGVWRTVSGRRVFIRDGQSLTDAMRESGKFEGELAQKQKSRDYELEVEPRDVQPVNPITDYDKFNALAYDFETDGYDGRPIVAVELGDGQYQALTGSHRIFAAREAGIEIPVKSIEYNDGVQELLDAADDMDRARIADELLEDGLIDNEARNLLRSEIEFNDAEWDDPNAKEVMKLKAELYKRQAEQRKAAEKSLRNAQKQFEEQQRQIAAKALEAKPEMKKYKDYLANLEGKYKNIWAEMSDSEMGEVDRLERAAYGK